MNAIELKNGMVRLTSENGVKDTRNGKVYSEVVVKTADVKHFVDAE